MNRIAAVLRREEFRDRPPVLVDVGASGAIHRDWAVLAPHAVCVAFDADAREMGYVEKSASGYRKLVVYGAILHDADVESAEFHLTRSPYCSSALRPRTDRLAEWAFRDLFDVVETKRMRTVTLPRVLAEQRLEQVDWFKTDSQGMDLRLFASLGEERVRRVLAAQFEPGILDAYEGEDPLESLLAFMRPRGFWLSELATRGTARIGARAEARLGSGAARRVRRGLRTSPGWVEATYLNTLAGPVAVRDRLLGWVIATLRRQHGFALEVALAGSDASGDAMFAELARHSSRAIGRGALAFPALAALRKLRAMAERRFWT